MVPYNKPMNEQLPQVFIGSDHGGFSQKELIRSYLLTEGYKVTDCGTYTRESTDYPDFALAVCKAVVSHSSSFGILLCRSGEGMEMAANKVHKIRAALVWTAQVAAETRHDNDANVLVLPSDFITDAQATEIARAFLATEFSHEERHQRRIDKITTLEQTAYRHES